MKRRAVDLRLNGENELFEITAQNELKGVCPQVTVVVSLYNYQNHVIHCLESVRVQTISSLDLVVVDDCSTDGSLELVRKWLLENGNRFSRYLLISNKYNKGLASTRNTAIAMARTKYVFVLDADNLLYPRCLERLVPALEYSNASFAYCYLEKFGNEKGLLNTKPWNPIALQHGNTIDAMVLLSKQVWEQVGGYSDMEVMGWEDFDLWFKVARIKGWGILVPEILARYRVHRRSMLNTITNPNADKLWKYLQSSYPEFFSQSGTADTMV